MEFCGCPSLGACRLSPQGESHCALGLAVVEVLEVRLKCTARQGTQCQEENKLLQTNCLLQIIFVVCTTSRSPFTVLPPTTWPTCLPIHHHRSRTTWPTCLPILRHRSWTTWPTCPPILRHRSPTTWPTRLPLPLPRLPLHSPRRPLHTKKCASAINSCGGRVKFDDRRPLAVLLTSAPEAVSSSSVSVTVGKP